MSRLLPGMIAVAGASLLAVILLAPFVFRSYRRRGEVGLGPTLLAFGLLVYSLALVAYTLLPIPSIDEAWCATQGTTIRPQLNPLQMFDDIAKENRGGGLRDLVTNPAVQQVVFNVALFVPLGAYLRHYFRRGAVTAILIGFAVSLLIELTQLTGNWFLMTCPYRLFDVDDLIANTLGAGIGVLLAPALRLFSGRRGTAPADAPRPVTTGRRVLGMLVDLVTVFALGAFLAGAAGLIALYGFDVRLEAQPWGRVAGSALGAWLPAVLLLAIPSFGRHSATLGQRAVRLHRTRPGHSHPGIRVIPALLTGVFGYYVLFGLGEFVPFAGSLAQFMLVVCLVFAWRPRSHRGLSGIASGLLLTDSRAGAESDRAVGTVERNPAG
ncbi:VanZ family protein [Amycolatopsis antarctica]|uniref:VanZ family protein n=1 Tax=Amycolatopsis antarctica TaxID=1854586 RepID=UPI0013FD8C26|nr:VanZ family protein [Amycolatopsis antarctica]